MWGSNFIVQKVFKGLFTSESVSPSVSNKHSSSGTLQYKKKHLNLPCSYSPSNFIKDRFIFVTKVKAFFTQTCSFVFLLSMKPTLFCKQKFFKWLLFRFLINCYLFLFFFLPCRIDKNARLVNGASLKTCFRIFFALFNNYALTYIVRSSEFSIDQGFLQRYCSFHQDSFQL